MACPYARDYIETEEERKERLELEEEFKNARRSKRVRSASRTGSPATPATPNREGEEAIPSNNQPLPPDLHNVSYGSYLCLDKILDAQKPASEEPGQEPAHSEMLFIITHQTYELWFKQILHELDSVNKIFSQDFVKGNWLLTVASRLERITEIQRILIEQIRVLETMTPMEFLDFRHLLTPASGFQSLQFRLIENKLGLTHRLKYQNKEIAESFDEEEEKILRESTENTLFQSIEKWLERMPFVQEDHFIFWDEYRQAVDAMLSRERASIETYTDEMIIGEDGELKRNPLIVRHEKTEQFFADMFDEDKYNDLIRRGDRRLSYRACQSALFIYAYREQPVLQLPYRILNTLTEIDENLVTWRFRHVMMVQRMIGMKTGTGGSSGYYYLRSTVSDRYKIFLDFMTLSTYIIPHHSLPKLSEITQKRLGFTYMY